MNRHVIKGRGPNRGKYLCYARVAGLPPESGYVWLPEQRKAARWDDERLRGETFVTLLAREHNGYFVKVTASRATIARVDELRAFIREHAAGADEKLACYWFAGELDLPDASVEYCRDCAEKIVDKLYGADPKGFAEHFDDCETAEDRYNVAIDGGSDIEHDSTPYCETCGATLRGNLTESGADDEIEAYTGDCVPGFDKPNDWDRLDDALVNVSNDDPRWRAVARVVDAATIAEREHETRVAAFSARTGMAEARTGLLDLLAARAVQKAPEPSFRLWDEFQAWMPVRRDGTPETEATEKCLFKEAIRFLGFCGIRAYMTNGGMGMADAPHGTYYWPFIVETEQRRLWKDADLEAGRVVGRACLVSDDAPRPRQQPVQARRVRRAACESLGRRLSTRSARGIGGGRNSMSITMTPDRAAREALKHGDRVAIIDGTNKLVAVETIASKMTTLIKTGERRAAWSIATGGLARNAHRADGGTMIRKATPAEVERWDLTIEVNRAAYRAKHSAEILANERERLRRVQAQVGICEAEIAKHEPLVRADQERLLAAQAKLAALGDPTP